MLVWRHRARSKMNVVLLFTTNNQTCLFHQFIPTFPLIYCACLTHVTVLLTNSKRRGPMFESASPRLMARYAMCNKFVRPSALLAALHRDVLGGNVYVIDRDAGVSILWMQDPPACRQSMPSLQGGGTTLVNYPSRSTREASTLQGGWARQQAL